MVKYISRSGWTSTSASGRGLSGSKLKGVAVHWPGTSQNTIGTSGIKNRLRGYRDYHVGTRGWRDIGYNFAIDQAGNIYMLRATAWHGNLVGAHAASGGNPDANEEYVGVLLVLGDQENPSAKMKEAFRHWYHNKFLDHWGGRTDVRGHGQVSGASTSCPGPRARNAIDEMTHKPQEDEDMVGKIEAPNGEEWNVEHAMSWIMSRLSNLSQWGDYVTTPNGKEWSLSHAMSWMMRRDQEQRQRIAELAAQVSGLASAIEQLSGGGIDVGVVQEAAQRGAEEALRDVEVTVDFDVDES